MKIIGHNIKMLMPEPYHSHHDAYLDNYITMRLIPKNDFSILLFNNRDFAAQFIKMLANKAEETELQLIDLAYRSVRRKVANALLKFTNEQSSSSTVNISVSRDDLASKAGTAKETLIRTLSDFQREGLIEIQNKSIIIHDCDELKHLISKSIQQICAAGCIVLCGSFF